MTAFVQDEEYEALVAAICFIDAAIQTLKRFEPASTDFTNLHQTRNRLNAQRVKILGNGGSRPFFVSEVV